MEFEETKSKLQGVLKASFDTYWDHFKKFIRGKISKVEFDSHVKTLLSDAHVGLHNQLVLTLLRTTHKVYVPRVPARPVAVRDHQAKQKDKFGNKKAGMLPPAVDSRHKAVVKTDKLKDKKAFPSHRPDVPVEPPSPVKRKLTPAEAAAAAVKRVRTAPRVDPMVIKLKRFRDTNGILRPLVVRPRLAGPPTSRATDADRQLAAISPELAALRQRMLRLALEHGLTEVSSDSVQLMMLALEQHLKTVLGNCSRARGPVTAAPTEASSPAAPTPAAPTVAATPTMAPTVTPPAGSAAPAGQPAVGSGTSSVASSTTPSSAAGASGGAALRPVLHTPDLWCALRCGPYLLGEDLPLNQERLVAYTSFH